jgi:hypothetical protein
MGQHLWDTLNSPVKFDLKRINNLPNRETFLEEKVPE